MESKKRYFGYSWENKKMIKNKIGPFEAKGIETVRRDGVKATSSLMLMAVRALFRVSRSSPEVNHTYIHIG